jgi:GrpB-like predicted nucleotidyltransferase (UPF0157 family)
MQKYVFRPYTEKYPEYFTREKETLQALLGDGVVIEHIGSTSVPGLGGKGFIDIGIAVAKKTELEPASAKLITAGYHYEPEASTENRYYYDREFIDDQGEVSMYHLHVTYANSEDWIAMVAFRNFLRSNDEALQEYAAIKKQAAELADNKRAVYVKMKNPVIEKLLKRALQDSKKS